MFFLIPEAVEFFFNFQNKIDCVGDEGLHLVNNSFVIFHNFTILVDLSSTNSDINDYQWLNIDI